MRAILSAAKCVLRANRGARFAHPQVSNRFPLARDESICAASTACAAACTAARATSPWSTRHPPISWRYSRRPIPEARCPRTRHRAVSACLPRPPDSLWRSACRNPQRAAARTAVLSRVRRCLAPSAPWPPQNIAAPYQSLSREFGLPAARPRPLRRHQRAGRRECRKLEPGKLVFSFSLTLQKGVNAVLPFQTQKGNAE